MALEPVAYSNIQLFSYADDPLARLADQLLEQHQHLLPRLDHTAVLLPQAEAAPGFRKLLLQKARAIGHEALLGPHITTLRSWLDDNTQLDDLSLIDNHRRQLVLVEALREHRNLFGEGNLWALADSLLDLFDELTLNQSHPPDDLNTFINQIGRGYGVEGKALAALTQEARLVHTLWHAWHQQLHSRNHIDHNTRYLLQLSQPQQLETHLYLLTAPTLSRAEQQWVQQMLQQKHFYLLLQGDTDEKPERVYHPNTPLRNLLESLQCHVDKPAEDEPYAQMLNTIFPAQSDSSPLRERANTFASSHPDSPLKSRLRIFSANGDEQEAHAVELQVRRWLLDGHKKIGIVSENRRLARRVRALLERSNIFLHDSTGWALSTTSAAATLEQWLQCIEDDFAHQPMLDLLKSPFMSTADEHDEHLKRVYRLEQDIVLHENIGSGLDRYLHQTRYRQRRLPPELAKGLDDVVELLDQLHAAAQPLSNLLSGQHAAFTYLDTLLDALNNLGLESGFNQDAAGLQLLDELQQMSRAVEGEELLLSWLEFRGWLGSHLEKAYFRSLQADQAVSLMGLSQSQMQQFDALVIAGMESEFLPGSPATTPFFNNAVKMELGLPGADIHQAERFYHFRRLLESSNQLLLTRRSQQDGEDILPSAWLETLRSFHLLAYDEDLEDSELERLTSSPDSMVVSRSAPLPEPMKQPSPSLEAPLLPERYSASAYQQLMNCPYQFFAAKGLRLAAPEEIRDALEKSDYGERVHRILEAFHGGIKGLPGPFNRRLDEQSRTEAEALLEKISHAVFAQDLEDNYLHRGWLHRWLEKIPAYVDWQLKREQYSHVETVEADMDIPDYTPDFALKGRLDRIDRMDTGSMAVVDYKTGSVSKEEDVLSGEAVQLPFYHLLGKQYQLPITQVEYLSLDGNKPGSKVILQDDILEQLSDSNEQRLREIHLALKASTGMPAWGDEKSCKYCQMRGVCRRGTWHDNGSENPVQ